MRHRWIEEYTERLIAHRQGKPVKFTPMEFLMYVYVDKPGRSIDRWEMIHALEAKMGYHNGYLSSDVPHDHHHPLPMPLQHKLGALSGTAATDPFFWGRTTYSPNDAEHIELVMERDISDIIARFARIGGHQARLKKDSNEPTPTR